MKDKEFFAYVQLRNLKENIVDKIKLTTDIKILKTINLILVGKIK